MSQSEIKTETQSPIGPIDSIEWFTKEAEKKAAIVHRVNGWGETIPRIAKIVAEADLSGVFAVPTITQDQLRQLKAHLKEVNLTFRAGNFRPVANEISVGLTAAAAGIAETGTLVCVDTGEDVRLASMLGTHHIVVISAETIVQKLSDIASFLNAAFAQGSCYVAMISGPSRTADIERALTIGVHGPHCLHIIVMNQEHE